MKNVILTLIILSFGTVSANALEPLILEPLHGYAPEVRPVDVQYNTGITNVAASSSATGSNAGYTASSNMVPQNDAAEGLPVQRKTVSNRVKIETKQGSRTNTQWNPGGKGTKSYF